MPKGRSVAVVTVTTEQREQLKSWRRRPKTAQALALRSRIVLLAADGHGKYSDCATVGHFSAHRGQVAAAISAGWTGWSSG